MMDSVKACRILVKCSLRGESVENIDMDFLTDLAFLGSKLMKQAKKMAKSLCKVVPQGQIKGGTFLPNL